MIRERKRKKEKGWTWKEGSPLLLPPSSIIARHCAKAKHLLLGKLWEQVCECVSALPSTSLSHSHHSMKLETERKKERKREPKSSSLVLQRQQQQQLSTAVKFDAVKCAFSGCTETTAAVAVLFPSDAQMRGSFCLSFLIFPRFPLFSVSRLSAIGDF